LIDEVAKEIGWRVSKDATGQYDFDLWWNDLGVDNQFLTGLKHY
jgi:hypothetical protein